MTIDYGAPVASFDCSYVANENNIYRKTFDHRSSDPYNEYSYDDLDRLVGVTYHDTDTEAFNMDDTKNRGQRMDGSVAQIRNSNIEMLNKFKIVMSKIQNLVRTQEELF